MRTFIFACVHNAGRSQMSAAFFNQLADPNWRAASPPGLNLPSTFIRWLWTRCAKWESTSASEAAETHGRAAQNAEMLITMGCGDECPYVPGLRRDDWPSPDPKGLPLK